jgi:hypothetical protein
MTESQLDVVLAYVRRAQMNVLDAAGIIRESPPAATMDRARLRLAEATGELSGATNLIYEALAVCDGCGSGKPGTIRVLADPSRSLNLTDKPCPVCQMEEGFQ